MIVFRIVFRVLMLLVCFSSISCNKSPRVENDFFNGASLDGWWAAEMKYWRVEDSAIVGTTTSSTAENDFLWSDVKVADFYLSVDVKLDSVDRNAGIQFRSEKVSDYGQAKGYQADIGLNEGEKIWGTLYHEHGRGLLNGSDAGEKVVKDGEWNRYEILVVGHRIWIAINGQVISATEDPGGELEGFISLQIHSGPPQTVRYKIRELIHNPEVSLAGKNEKELVGLLRPPLVPAEGHALFSAGAEEVISFAGGTNIANMQEDGYLETLLTSTFNTSKLVFRNIAWDGDQVDEQFRDVGFGTWQANVDSVAPTKLFIQFGQMESLRGEAELESFISKYRELLVSIRRDNRQIFVISPFPFEPSALNVNGKTHWANPLDSTATEMYVRAIGQMAREENFVFVDVFSKLRHAGRRITSNGVHLTEDGQLVVAEAIMASLGLKGRYEPLLDPLRTQVNYKNKIWFDYWRPGNWAFFKGDRQGPAFSRDWKNPSHRIFPEEIARYAPLLEEAEAGIREMQKQIKNKQPLQFAAQKPREMKNESNAKLLAPVQQQLAEFNILPGYNVELFASESLGIGEPCAMRWDEKGRLWVLCIPAYPQPLPGQPANDRLVILEDTNTDGRADKSTVFADNLNIPLGFELGHNGVYLGEQTRVVFLADTNNDLKADVRKTLLSGFGTHDSHQTINSFTWSPGGELFFSQGLSIHSFIETPWGVKKGQRGAIWRYRPLSGKLDNIVDQNIASENPWGMTFGDWGELWTKSNDTQVFYSSPSLAVSKYRSMIPVVGATVIKSGIVEIPRSGHLPEDLRNDLLIAGYYNNKVERIKVRNDGAGFKGKLLEPLLSSSSNTFRPVDIKTGPDGAIYVLDWYNPIIGHYQASLRDPMRDKIHGRVWRITAKNRPLNKVIDLSKLSLPDLVDQLSSDEYWVRYHARRALAARTPAEVLPAVKQWINALKSDRNHDRNLLEAIGIYESFEEVNPELLERLSKAKSAGARAYSAQVTGRWSDRLEDPLRILKRLIKDADPRVRMMAVVGLGSVQQAESMLVAAEISERPMDKFTQHAYNKTVFALSDVWEKAFRQNNLKFTKNSHLASVVSILTPAWFTGEMYRKLIESGNYSHDIKTNLFLALATGGNISDIGYVLKSDFARNNPIVIERLAGRTIPVLPDEISRQIVINLNDASNPGIQRLYIRMIGSWHLKKHLDALHEFTIKRSLQPEVVAEGLQVMTSSNYQDLNSALNTVCRTDQAAPLRRACIAGFAKTNLNRAAAETVREIKRAGQQNDLRQLLSLVNSEAGGADALAEEIKKQQLDSSQAVATLWVLTQDSISNPHLIASIEKFAPKTSESVPQSFNDTFAIRLAATVAAVGNAERGKKIYFERLACSSCHRIQGQGGDQGPNLSAIGSGLSVFDIITEVIWPNKNIKEGYFNVRVQLKNGQVFQGVRVFETNDVISIRQSATANARQFSKADIETITDVGSAMPAGLVSTISNEERAHLIKFLMEQKN